MLNMWGGEERIEEQIKRIKEQTKITEEQIKELGTNAKKLMVKFVDAAKLFLTGARIHALETWPEYFQAVKSGMKPFEIRENDRDYKIGDILILQEYIPETKEYTGETISVSVTYILDKQPFVPKKFVCMGIKPIN